MKTFVDWFARNRAKIGLALFMGWTTLQADADYQSWLSANTKARVTNSVAAAVIGYVAGAGAHKSDKYQRDKQEEEKAA